MEKARRLPNDPFQVTGERYSDRKVLEHLLGNREDDFLETAEVTGRWEEHDDGGFVMGPTRREIIRRTRIRGICERAAAAVLSAAFLIAPMLVMVLRKDQTTGLATATVFIILFGLLAVAVLRTRTEVVACTAAYAAVLVTKEDTGRRCVS